MQNSTYVDLDLGTPLPVRLTPSVYLSRAAQVKVLARQAQDLAKSAEQDEYLQIIQCVMDLANDLVTARQPPLAATGRLAEPPPSRTERRRRSAA